MAKIDKDTKPATKNLDIQRESAESMFAEELQILKENESEKIPKGWNLSPQSVLKFIIGGEVKGKKISSKYIGNQRLIEIAIATLLTDRSLLLIGEPGTAKSWLSENLAAAIHGDSRLVVQGTAGTTEEHIKYSWNYAMLIANGPTPQALIKSPVYQAMENGKIARVEEVSRCVPEVQDSLISLLSEKNIVVPELSNTIEALRGFSVIATANTRDKGVNDMSAALKRRFNIVVLTTPNDIQTEVNIVKKRVEETSESLDIQSEKLNDEVISKVVTVFQELRNGKTTDGKQKVKSPSGVMSTAEAISLLVNSMALAGSFNSGKVTYKDVSAGLTGAVVKEEDKDKVIWREYLENIMKKRGKEWKDLYMSCMELI